MVIGNGRRDMQGWDRIGCRRWGRGWRMDWRKRRVSERTVVDVENRGVGEDVGSRDGR